MGFLADLVPKKKNQKWSKLGMVKIGHFWPFLGVQIILRRCAGHWKFFFRCWLPAAKAPHRDSSLGFPLAKLRLATAPTALRGGGVAENAVAEA